MPPCRLILGMDSNDSTHFMPPPLGAVFFVPPLEHFPTSSADERPPWWIRQETCLVGDDDRRSTAPTTAPLGRSRTHA